MFAGFRIEAVNARAPSNLEGEGENVRLLIKVQEAAQRFEVTAPTIRTWIEKGGD
jgi:hypothetical protein